MKNMKKSEKKHSLAISAALGALLAMITTLLSTMVMGLFINNEYLCIESNHIAVGIIQIISALAGSIVAATMNENNRSMVALITGIAYYVLLLLSAMLLMDGLGEGIISGVVCTAIGVIGAILLGNIRTQGTKRGKRRNLSR